MIHYDHNPSVLEAVGNGSYRYRFNITEEIVENPDRQEENGQPETRTQWVCEEVIVFEPLSANKITEAVISTLCPTSHEQKLVNEFNAANLGLIGGSKPSDEAKRAIANYKAFLQKRADLKAQVDSDCLSLGIQ